MYVKVWILSVINRINLNKQRHTKILCIYIKKYDILKQAAHDSKRLSEMIKKKICN